MSSFVAFVADKIIVVGVVGDLFVLNFLTHCLISVIVKGESNSSYIHSLFPV